MSVTYNFPNLSAVADHLTQVAIKLRNDATKVETMKNPGWKMAAARLRSEASAFMQAAHVVRNSKIEERT